MIKVCASNNERKFKMYSIIALFQLSQISSEYHY